MGNLPYALQLYTVRDHMVNDPRGTLKKVKQLGYDFVEIAGTAGLSNEEFQAAIKDAGLQAISAHVGIEEVARNVNGVIKMCETFGIRFAVVSWSSAETKEQVLQNARILDTAGAALREAGVRLCYHNHAHEFVVFDGLNALDLLYATAAPQNLAAQLDVFWAVYGKADPVALLKNYTGRCPLLHVKDKAPEGTKPIFANLGQGEIAWKPIFAAAHAAGVEWYIVEQDECPGDSLESARIGAEFMKQQ